MKTSVCLAILDAYFVALLSVTAGFLTTNANFVVKV